MNDHHNYDRSHSVTLGLKKKKSEVTVLHWGKKKKKKEIQFLLLNSWSKITKNDNMLSCSHFKDTSFNPCITRTLFCIHYVMIL